MMVTMQMLQAARCSIAALFVDMPEYDLTLLFEDDLEDAE